MRTLVRASESTIWAVLLLLLAIAPIPYAAAPDWAWSPLVAAVGLLTLCWALTRVVAPQRGVFHGSSFTVISTLMSLVLLWAFVQLVPLWRAELGNYLFGMANETLRQPVVASVSIDRAMSEEALMRLLAYCGVFTLAADLARDTRKARALFFTLLGISVLITIYGWVMEAMFHSCLALAFIKRPLESGLPCTFSGTFVNSGNYATFAGLACIVCVVSLHQLMLQRSASETQWRRRLLRSMSVLSGVGSFYIICLVILISGLFLSNSRAGAFSTIIACLLVIGLLDTVRARKPRSFAAVAVVLIAIAGMLAVSGESLILRYLDLLQNGDPERAQLLRVAVSAVAERPWTGWGLGTFSRVYQIFQPASLELFYSKAHNTYLETASDLGIPAALMFFLAIAIIGGRCAWGARTRRRDLRYPAVAVGAIVLVGLHSLADFGGQIPATALTIAALLGTGWAQSWSSRESDS